MLKLRCAVQVTIKETELLRQLRAATNGGSAKVRKASVDAQEKFISDQADEPMSH